MREIPGSRRCAGWKHFSVHSHRSPHAQYHRHRFRSRLCRRCHYCLLTDSPTGPSEQNEPPPPATVTLQIDFTNIEVLEDCDGIEGDGDFRFTVTTSVSAGGGGSVYSGSPTLGNGARTSSLGRKEYIVPATDGQQVTVEFVASEQDRDIFGNVYNDDRMDNVRRTLEHKFNSGSWTPLGPQSILVGSGACRVRLNYVANAI